MAGRDDLWQGLGDAVRQLRRDAIEELTHPHLLIRRWLDRLFRRPR